MPRDSSSSAPANDKVCSLFLNHFRIRRTASKLETLRSVLRAFATLPYENLTKILAGATAGQRHSRRRSAAEVVGDHIRWGTGGTCFSLTNTLRHIVRNLGFEAEPLLADRHYGTDTHCALAVWIDEMPHLVDPGYLLVEPIPLRSAGVQEIQTSFHKVQLVPRPDGRRLDLYTVTSGSRSLRFTIKTDPVDWSQFERAWEESFGWDMMHYPVVTRVVGGEHLYLQGNRLQSRSGSGVTRTELDPRQLAGRIAATFGIDVQLVARALAVLQSHGDVHGTT